MYVMNACGKQCPSAYMAAVPVWTVESISSVFMRAENFAYFLLI